MAEEERLKKNRLPAVLFHPLRLLLGVGAAHALVALAGVAVAVRAHVDGFQLAHVLGVVVAAGGHGAMDGLVHDLSLQRLCF